VLGVSIVLYRSPLPAVAATVHALVAQSVPPDLVRVHANATSDDEAHPIQERLASAAGPLRWQLTASRDNQGFAAAHNTALAELFDAGCTAVVVLNPDLVLAPTALAELNAAAQRLPATALLGPVLELADPHTMSATGTVDTLGIVWTRDGRHLDSHQGEPLVDLPAAPVKVAGISGACLYVGREGFDAVRAGSGGEFFDPDFIAYREDAELAYRAAILGVESFLVPAARGLHARRLRGTSRGADAAIDALGVRNRFLIAFKYGRQRPGGMLAPLRRDIVVVAAVLLRERSSLPGLREAWRLRHRMRAKGRQVRGFAGHRQ
jgi:GT2 family glycosyltransferase